MFTETTEDTLTNKDAAMISVEMKFALHTSAANLLSDQGAALSCCKMPRWKFWGCTSTNIMIAEFGHMKAKVARPTTTREPFAKKTKPHPRDAAAFDSIMTVLNTPSCVTSGMQHGERNNRIWCKSNLDKQARQLQKT